MPQSSSQSIVGSNYYAPASVSYSVNSGPVLLTQSSSSYYAPAMSIVMSNEMPSSIRIADYVPAMSVVISNELPASVIRVADYVTSSYPTHLFNNQVEEVVEEKQKSKIKRHPWGKGKKIEINKEF